MAHRYQPVCHCAAYRFPHRAGGGACEACDGQQLCEACRLPAEGYDCDFGVGLTEFWGRVSRHTDVQHVSECCEAPLIENRPEPARA